MDITTYKMAQKYANNVAAGFSHVEVKDSDIIFTLNDGKTAKVSVPTPAGLKGDKGDPGIQGPKGDKGDKGDTGAQGPQGIGAYVAGENITIEGNVISATGGSEGNSNENIIVSKLDKSILELLNIGLTLHTTNWTSGGIGDDGQYTTDNTKLRSSTTTQPKPMLLHVKKGYKYRVFKGENVPFIKTTEWDTNDSVYYPKEYRYKIEVSSIDENETLTTSQGNEIISINYLDLPIDLINNISNEKTCDLIDISEFEWEFGSFDQQGVKVSNTQRLRTKNPIFAKKGSVIYNSSAYKWKIMKSRTYKVADTYIDTIPSSKITEVSDSYIVDEDCYISIALHPEIGKLTDNGNNFIEYTSSFQSKAYTNKPLLYNQEIFDTNALIDGTLSKTDGSYSAGVNSLGLGKFIVREIGSNHKVYLKNNLDVNNELNCVVCFADKYGNFISSIENKGNFTFITPKNTQFVTFNLNNDYIDGYSIKYEKMSFMFEEEKYRLIQDTPKVKLIAHRGYYKYAPEHTIPAYIEAGKKGFWGIKIDVCETLDGYFVCSHDRNVDRMFDGTGNIRELTLAQIQEMTVDNGNGLEDYPNEKIVTLEQALAICKTYNMHPYIEFKKLLSDESVNRVLEIIRNYGFLKTCLCQYSNDIESYIIQLRKCTDIIPIVYWKPEYDYENVKQKLDELGNCVYSLNSMAGNEVSQFETYVEQIREKHLPVCTASCHNVNYIKKWIKDYGLDLVVTGTVTYDMIQEIES